MAEAAASWAASNIQGRANRPGKPPLSSAISAPLREDILFNPVILFILSNNEIFSPQRTRRARRNFSISLHQPSCSSRSLWLSIFFSKPAAPRLRSGHRCPRSECRDVPPSVVGVFLPQPFVSMVSFVVEHLSSIPEQHPGSVLFQSGFHIVRQTHPGRMRTTPRMIVNRRREPDAKGFATGGLTAASLPTPATDNLFPRIEILIDLIGTRIKKCIELLQGNHFRSIKAYSDLARGRSRSRGFYGN